MSKQSRTGRARIPSMTSLLEAAAARRQLGKIPQSVLTDALRQAVDAVRRTMENGESADRCNAQALLDDAEKLIAARNAARLRRVINATGIVLHTGLGRSVLADAARERLAGAAAGYSNLEIDLDSGQRGRRGAYAERLLCELTGATAAMIVNNNAAATMLALRGLAHGREVIVSRGHLIEIGGSFRLPEVMTAGGVVLREVGTTNKTRVSDFEAAVCERTALIMHVHTSNYRVVGFAETPSVGALVALAHDRGLPLLDDLGSGALLDDPLWTAASEPSVLASLAQGADLLTFSADKLLGGPQAGILIGTAEIIDRLRRDPMARALRVDKLTLGALEATLELYQSPETMKTTIPTLARLAESVDSLSTRAEALRKLLSNEIRAGSFEIVREESFAGGGSLPAWPLPTAAVAWTLPAGSNATELSRRLRLGEPAVLARIRGDRILFDLRTLTEDESREVVSAVNAALAD